MTFRPYPVLTLFTAVSVVILIMFGNWQWSRYEEKTAAKAKEPEWASVAGTLLPGTTLQVYTLTGGKAAWRSVRRCAKGDPPPSWTPTSARARCGSWPLPSTPWPPSCSSNLRPAH